MSLILEIQDESGAEHSVETDPPWAIGGHEEADLKLAEAPERVLAYIGCAEGHFFIQPMTAEAGLHRNGRPHGASVWIGHGDRLVVGGYRLRCATGEGRLRLENAGKAAAAFGPVQITAPGGAEAAVSAPDYRPQEAAPPKRGLSRRWRAAIYAGFAVLAAAVAFVLLATPVEITVEPKPDRLTLEGFPPPITIAGRRVAVPGGYSLEARREGYKPLSREIRVTGEENSFSFEMEKKPGLLFVTVTPKEAEAWVALDGETLARAPIEERKVPAGEHTLRVEAERYLAHEQTLTVTGMGEPERLEIALEPAWAEVTVATTPSDARVLLDGREVARTPATLEVMQGRHSLRLEKSEHIPVTRELTIEPGVAETVGPVTLEAQPGRLALASEPAGASFSLDERFLGKGPVTAEIAPRQRHTLKAEMPGYRTLERELTLAPGERRELRLEMEPEYGTVFVRADPPDAKLIVDGEEKGRAVQRLRLQTVAHRIKIAKEGYHSYETTVLPKAGISDQITVELRELTKAEKLGISETLTTAGDQTLQLLGPGSFTMGAPRRQPGRRANERQREVALSRRFYLSERPVTNAQFRRFRSEHSSGREGRESLNTDAQPVVGVSWQDAARYLNWLSKQDGLEPAYAEKNGSMRLKRPVGTGYRLPTEAEWAWAARMAGRDERAKFGWGETFPPSETVANFADESASDLVPVFIEGYTDGFAVTSPVGEFPANPAGLYDMHGNVSEWVNDYYDIAPPSGQVAQNPLGPDSGQHRVVRGTSWKSATIQRLRLSYRDFSAEPQIDLGFRIARYAEPPEEEE